eukprot:1547626-Amphidinium_carterae.1
MAAIAPSNSACIALDPLAAAPVAPPPVVLTVEGRRARAFAAGAPPADNTSSNFVAGALNPIKLGAFAPRVLGFRLLLPVPKTFAT